MGDPYQTLGVGRDASKSEIKSAYYRQAQQHHPDHHAQADAATRAAAESRFRQAKDAYDALSSNSRRADFHSGPRSSSHSSASSGTRHEQGGGAHSSSSSSASGGSGLILHGQGGGAHSSSSGSGGSGYTHHGHGGGAKSSSSSGSGGYGGGPGGYYSSSSSSSGSGGYGGGYSSSSSGSSGYGRRRRAGARSYSSTSGPFRDQYDAGFGGGFWGEKDIYPFAPFHILNYAKTVDPEKVRQHEERVRQERIRAQEEKEARKLAWKIAKAEFTERMKTMATKKKTEFVEWVKNKTSYTDDGWTMNWWDS